MHHSIEIDVLPREIPEEISIDVADLARGGHVTAGECPLPESAELLIDPEELLLMVAEPRMEAEEEGLEGEETGEMEEIPGFPMLIPGIMWDGWPLIRFWSA
jgi:large subunit ribosomal protein L25